MRKCSKCGKKIMNKNKTGLYQKCFVNSIFCFSNRNHHPNRLIGNYIIAKKRRKEVIKKYGL